MAEQPVVQMEEEFIDLRSIFKVIGKWRKVIIGGTLLAVLTAALLSFFVLPPVYEAKALLLVTLATDKQQTAQQSGEGVEGVVEPLTRIPVLTINTYLGQLQSEELMRRVIGRLKLDPAVYTPKSLAQMVNASVQKDSNLIELTVQNSDPRLAADIANAVCKEFLELLSQKNQEQMGRSVELLQKQRQETEKELEKAIQNLKKFQSQPRGVAVLEEEFKLMPISPYAATKVAGELLGHVYSHLYGIRFIALRFFTVYGPRQRPDLAIHKFARLMLKREPIPVYGDGTSRRDYTYIDDIIQGVRAAMDYTKTQYEVINLGNNRTVSLMELIRALEEVLGVEAKLEYLPPQPGDVPLTLADMDKAGKLLCYTPVTNLFKGLFEFKKWITNVN